MWHVCDGVVTVTDGCKNDSRVTDFWQLKLSCGGAMMVRNCYGHTPERTPAMRAIKEARHLIEEAPNDESAQILARLVLALETEISFAISDIYTLNRTHFELALRILQEWRLDRYYAGKARLFDTAFNVAQPAAKD
jgi:hypothetical protein